jgi:hypothetical protein
MLFRCTGTVLRLVILRLSSYGWLKRWQRMRSRFNLGGGMVSHDSPGKGAYRA